MESNSGDWMGEAGAAEGPSGRLCDEVLWRLRVQCNGDVPWVGRLDLGLEEILSQLELVGFTLPYGIEL